MSASYSDKTDYSSLLATPVSDVLAYFGKRTGHRGYMYYSPFRDEREPSMRVTVNSADGSWVWADYGGSPTGGRHVDGGGVLDMVRRLSVGVTRSYREPGGLEWTTGPERFTVRDPVGLIRSIEDVIRRTVGLLGRPGEELEFGMFAPFRGMLIGSLGPDPDVVNLVSDGIPLEDGTTRAAVRVGEMRDTGELELLLGLLESNYSHFTMGMGLDRLPNGDIDISARGEGTWVTLRRYDRRGTGIKR